jgi:hypothetical protein
MQVDAPRLLEGKERFRGVLPWSQLITGDSEFG